jgi:outer membrane autotransporter protein
VKNTQGIYVYSSSKTGSNTLNFNGTGTVTMNEGGEAVLVENSKSTGNFTNMAVTTKSTQNTARGYHVKDNGTLTITGGSIVTSGSNAIADAQGILVDNATFTQSTTSPTIKVNNAAGLEVINKSTANLNTDLNITKIGYGSGGLVATSGTINLNSGTTTVNLNDNATDSTGLLVSAPAGSTATANVAGGTMVINTSNADTSAMHVFSMASGGASTLTGTPTIILNGADGGVVVEGAQASANLDALTITDNNAKAIGLYGTNSSTTNVSGMTTINGAATGAKADADATVNIAGAQIKAATALEVGDGSATLNVNSAGGNTVNIVGNLLGSGSTAGSVMNVNLDSANTSVTGAATANLQTINMSLANSGVWNMTGTSTVTNVTSDSGIINMRASSITGDTYENLTTDTYTANNGNLVMDTDLNSESIGDKLYIKNSSSGNSTIQIHDVSLLNDTEVTGVKNLLLVDGATEGTTFVGKNLDAGGLWETTPTIKVGTQALDANGNPVGTANQWYLTTIAKKVNKDTGVLLKDAINTHTSWLWRSTNDTLRQRLGDLRRDKNNETGEGVWARYRNGRYDGSGLEGSYGLFQVGYDKKLNHSAAFGLAYETGAGRASYEYGRSEETVNDFSLYGTWYGKDGVYTDLIGSAGLIEDDTASFGNYPDKFTSREHAFKISLEHGKTIPFGKDKQNFFEPQAQIILSRMNGRNYGTDRQTNVDISATNSVVGRLGFVLGRKTPDKNDIYLKASVLREFAGHQDMNLAAYNGEHMHIHNDFGETWWEVGVGGNWNLSKVSHLYADVERSFGASVEKTVQINAGLRFEF